MKSSVYLRYCSKTLASKSNCVFSRLFVGASFYASSWLISWSICRFGTISAWARRKDQLQRDFVSHIHQSRLCTDAVVQAAALFISMAKWTSLKIFCSNWIISKTRFRLPSYFIPKNENSWGAPKKMGSWGRERYAPQRRYYTAIWVDPRVYTLTDTAFIKLPRANLGLREACEVINGYPLKYWR